MFAIEVGNPGKDYALALSQLPVPQPGSREILVKTAAAGVNRASRELGLQDHVSIIGPDCCSVYTTRDQEGKPSQPFRTLFIQETMKRGLLMPSSIVSYAHSDEDIATTVERIAEALVVYKKALNEGIGKYLEGRPVKPVYRKYND